ncbi:MAG: hypothetical protein MJA27_18475, partial [Pseudanabaenales cyanobacterium]|nr:hypothetical protein [Pseudanabaenales cyanobacterium]
MVGQDGLVGLDAEILFAGRIQPEEVRAGGITRRGPVPAKRRVDRVNRAVAFGDPCLLHLKRVVYPLGHHDRR